MLTYTMDVEERSRWIIATPSASQVAEPFFCTEVGDFYARSKFITTRSGKNSFILFYTLDGEGTVVQGGQKVVLPHGTALLMDCRTPQSYFTSPGHERWYHLWAHIDGPGVELAGKILGLPRLTPVELPFLRLQSSFDQLFRYLGDETIGARALTGLASHALAAELVAAHTHKANAPKSSPIARAVTYVDAHYAEKISLNELAAQASVSPSHLVRLFKAQLGTTPHDYLLRRRITRAKELLAETTLTGAAIAKQVGFSSESTFSYRFGKMVGQSPRAYREGSPGLSA